MITQKELQSMLPDGVYVTKHTPAETRFAVREYTLVANGSGLLSVLRDKTQVESVRRDTRLEAIGNAFILSCDLLRGISCYSSPLAQDMRSEKPIRMLDDWQARDMPQSSSSASEQ